MSVDQKWLNTVRSKNRAALGLAGLGGGMGGVAEQIAADFERRRTQGPVSPAGAALAQPGAPPPGGASLVPNVPFVPSRLPRILAFGAAGVLVAAIGFVAYQKLRR